MRNRNGCPTTESLEYTVLAKDLCCLSVNCFGNACGQLVDLVSDREIRFLSCRLPARSGRRLCDESRNRRSDCETDSTPESNLGNTANIPVGRECGIRDLGGLAPPSGRFHEHLLLDVVLSTCANVFRP